MRLDGDTATAKAGAARGRRWVPIVLGATLALSVLVLSILDYAVGARNVAVIIAAVVLLALLAFLLLRVGRRERGTLAALARVPEAETAAGAAALILAALTLAAAALRLYGLGQESFWYDETWTATWAAQPVSKILGTTNALPYLVAHWTLAVGRSEFVLRLAPALAGIALIPVTYLLGRAMYRRNEGLIAAGLLTVSMYAVYHSQELRFYAWEMLFSTLSLYFLLRGLERGRWLDWTGFAVSTVLNLYSHPAGLFVLGSEGLYTLAVVAGELRRPAGAVAGGRLLPRAARRLGPPGLAAAAALAAFAPGAALMAQLYRSPIWAVEAGLAGTDMMGGLWFNAPIATWTYQLPSLLLGLKHPLLLALMFTLFFVGLIASPRRWSVLVALWVALPPLVLFAVKMRFYDRYLSYLLPLFIVVVARAIDYLAFAIRPRQAGRWAALALLTALVAAPNLAQLPEYYRGTQKEQWRELVAYVEANRRPGDTVIAALNSAVAMPQEPFQWYRTVPDAELPWQLFAEGGTLTRLARQGELPALVEGHARAWFVLPAGTPDVEEVIGAALEGRYRLAHRQEFIHLNTLLYEAGPP